MKLINFFLEKLINPAYAQLNESDFTQTTCYLSGPVDPIEQLTRASTVILSYFLAPIASFILAIFHAVKLLKRTSSNLYYEIYRGFSRTLILAASFFIIALLINAIYDFYYLNGYLYLQFVIILISTTIAAGFGYLIISIKSKQLLTIALPFIFVLPALVIFLLYIILKLFPSLKKYGFNNLFETKKDKLAKKLEKQGTIKPKNNVK